MLTEPLRLVVQLAASLGFGSNNINDNVDAAAIFLSFNFGRLLGAMVAIFPTNWLKPCILLAIRAMLSRSIAINILDIVTGSRNLSASSFADFSASIFLE
jgi:hypothetical protein